MSMSERQEAREWLANNANPYALASNRFRSTQEAAAFVEQLYASGAVTVDVTNILQEDWRIEAEGGPYADALIVCLPDDAEQRRTLFALCNEEMAAEGFEANPDAGQAEIFMWWD